MNKYFSIFVLLGFAPFFSGCGPILDFNEQISQEFSFSLDTKDIVSNEAKALLEQKRKELSDYDLNQGPCLGWLNDEWVVDIAHNPRIPEDDRPENQCPEIANETATHFVLISPEGQILKVK